MKNIILTLLSIPKVGKKSVGYFIKYMQEIPKNENDYTIKCKISDNNETIFEVKTFAGSRDRAKRIVDNWNKNASKIYPKILDILLNDESSTD